MTESLAVTLVPDLLLNINPKKWNPWGKGECPFSKSVLDGGGEDAPAFGGH